MHIKVDNCVGASSLRSYAVLTSSSSDNDDIVAYYGTASPRCSDRDATSSDRHPGGGGTRCGGGGWNSHRRSRPTTHPALPIPVPGGESAPPPPADPAFPASTETRQNPISAMADLLGAPTSTVMNLAPSAGGADPLAPAVTLYPPVLPDADTDMESPYLLTQDAPAGPFARVDAFKGAHALVHGSLGRMPAAELASHCPVPLHARGPHCRPDRTVPPASTGVGAAGSPRGTRTTASAGTAVG